MQLCVALHARMVERARCLECAVAFLNGQEIIVSKVNQLRLHDNKHTPHGRIECSYKSWGICVSIPNSSIPTLSISHFVNSHLVNVDEVGIDKVGS